VITASAAAVTVSGGAGIDTINIQNGQADGGDGDDQLEGHGNDYQLLGGWGRDYLYMSGAGGNQVHDGGEGNDVYNVLTDSVVWIKDSGVTFGDGDLLWFKNVLTSNLRWGQLGNDLAITTVADLSDGILDSGVRLVGWYSGSNTMEYLVGSDANGTSSFIDLRVEAPIV
jgi:Ca2+-binding RTX toxin-like protein